MQNSEANKSKQNLITPNGCINSEVYHGDSLKTLSWQQQLSDTIKNVTDLCLYLKLDPVHYSLNPNFPLRVPKYYLNKITKNDPQDPLLLQILPQLINADHTVKEFIDPLNEKHYIKTPGLIHKYYNRVLLTVTGACGIHCRYCFRQNFPYNDNVISNKQRQLQIEYLEAHPEINEVILSGGDPLCVNNKVLSDIIAPIHNIPHIKTLRFHSRMPLVIPDRIDQDFLTVLKKYNNLNYVLVTHCNHPNELDPYIKVKMGLLKQNNITLLNQSVLLHQINDNADTLITLSNKLFECHILPYYLHMLDPVIGSNHFNVDTHTAKQLMTTIQAKLPGYLVPKLVREIAGQPNKTLIV
jgi:EF-P beta-lysylation protein EpmB